MKVISAIICDDIRHEVSRKDLLIGVYAGAITVSAVPFTIPLAVWIELSPDTVGEHLVGMRLSYAGDEVLTAEAKIDVHALGNVSLPMSGINLASAKLGDIVVEFSNDRKNWIEVRRKKIIKGKVPSLMPPPLASS